MEYVSTDPSPYGFSVSSITSYSFPRAGERRGTSSQREIYGSLLGHKTKTTEIFLFLNSALARNNPYDTGHLPVSSHI